MIYSFDYFERYESPELILCNPNDDEIGVITNYSELKLNICLNEISELSYKIYNNDRELQDENGNPREDVPNIYRLHIERRQVRVVGIGYFIITEINEYSDDNGVYKSVTAKSCEYELTNVTMPYIDSVYMLYTSASYGELTNAERFSYVGQEDPNYEEGQTGHYLNKNCLLYECLKTVPSWSLKNAEKFDSVEKYRNLARQFRTFENSDISIYNFLKDELQESFECFVMFDIEHRQIDILTYDDVLKETNIILSTANILDSCEVDTSIDDYVNSLDVSGGSDNINIGAVNPMGTSVIYNFRHDKNAGLMSDDLKGAIEYWEGVSTGTRAIGMELKVPLRVYPDYLQDRPGNNFYYLLRAYNNACEEWVNNYIEAKANNKYYRDEPPALQISSTGTGSSIALHIDYNIGTELADAVESYGSVASDVFDVEFGDDADRIVNYGTMALRSSDNLALSSNTSYGNVNTTDRVVIEWNQVNLDKYESAIKSWFGGEDYFNSLQTNYDNGYMSVSTLIGQVYPIDVPVVGGTFVTMYAAMTPIVNYLGKAYILSRSQIDQNVIGSYLYEITYNSISQYNTTTIEQIYDTDKAGIMMSFPDGDSTVSIPVKNMIMYISSSESEAEAVVRKIRLIGNTGSMALECENLVDIMKYFGVAEDAARSIIGFRNLGETFKIAMSENVQVGGTTYTNVDTGIYISTANLLAELYRTVNDTTAFNSTEFNSPDNVSVERDSVGHITALNDKDVIWNIKQYKSVITFNNVIQQWVNSINTNLILTQNEILALDALSDILRSIAEDRVGPDAQNPAESFYSWDEEYTDSAYITVDQANKMLLYLQEEQNYVESALTKLNELKRQYEIQRDALMSESASALPTLEDSESSASGDMISEQITMINTFIASIDTQIDNLEEILSHLKDWVARADNVINGADGIRQRTSFIGAFYDYALLPVSSGGLGIATATEALDKANELYTELSRILKQQSYKDDTVVITEAMNMDERFSQEYELYARAIALLDKLCDPSSSIKVDAEPFIFNSDYHEYFKDEPLTVGMKIYAELPSGDVPAYMLTSLDIDYEEAKCELEFSDRLNNKDPLQVFTDLSAATAATADLVATQRINWTSTSVKVNELMADKTANLNLTAREMANSINNVSIGTEGFRCYALDKDNQEQFGMWGANGVLMFQQRNSAGTMENRAAVGRIIKGDGSVEYGFIGDAIIANTITAEKLAVGAASKGSNLIENGSFEGFTGIVQQDGGDSRKLIKWRVQRIESADNSNRIKNDSYDGSYALGLPVNDEAYQTLTNVLASTYMLSFYHKLPARSRVSVALDRIQGGNYSNIVTCTATNDSGSDEGWKRSHILVTIPSTCDVLVSITAIGLPGYSSGDILVDDILLEQGNTLNEYTPYISETYSKYTAIDEGGIRVYGGNITVYDREGNKKIYTEGNNLNVEGTITASAGRIGHWNINDNNDNGLTYSDYGQITSNGVSSSASKFYMGLIPEAAHPQESSSSQPTYLDSSETVVMYAGSHPLDYSSQTKPEFYVTADGSLYASKAYLTGMINANSGFIGNWQINHQGNNGLMSSVTYQGTEYTVGMMPPTAYNSRVIFAGNTNADNPAFYVTANGALYAANARITGDITASSLTLAEGVTIDYGKISNTPSIPDAVDKFTGSTSNTSIRIRGGQLSANDYVIYVGGSGDYTSNPIFTVDAAGRVMCKSLTADQIHITTNSSGGQKTVIGTDDSASWTVESGSTYSKMYNEIDVGNGHKHRTMIQVGSQSNSYAFCAGDRDDPEFYVLQNGSLVATNADITGSLTTRKAGSGSNYNITLDGYKLSFKSSDSEYAAIATTQAYGAPNGGLAVVSPSFVSFGAIKNGTYSSSLYIDTDYNLSDGFNSVYAPIDKRINLGRKTHPFDGIETRDIVFHWPGTNGSYRRIKLILLGDPDHDTAGTVTWQCIQDDLEYPEGSVYR